jgi:hypothetical protein
MHLSGPSEQHVQQRLKPPQLRRNITSKIVKEAKTNTSRSSLLKA